jgi:hypothetical protein
VWFLAFAEESTLVNRGSPELPGVEGRGYGEVKLAPKDRVVGVVWLSEDVDRLNGFLSIGLA